MVEDIHLLVLIDIYFGHVLGTRGLSLYLPLKDRDGYLFFYYRLISLSDKT